jgi:hypothetical protein
MADLDEAFLGPLAYIGTIKDVILPCCGPTPAPDINTGKIYSDHYTESTVDALMKSNDCNTDPWKGTPARGNFSALEGGRFPSRPLHPLNWARFPNTL